MFCAVVRRPTVPPQGRERDYEPLTRADHLRLALGPGSQLSHPHVSFSYSTFLLRRGHEKGVSGGMPDSKPRTLSARRSSWCSAQNNLFARGTSKGKRSLQEVKAAQVVEGSRLVHRPHAL